MPGWRGSAGARQIYELAVEIAECQRLVKGYGDTHERGLTNFTTIMQFIDRATGEAELAARVRRLRARRRSPTRTAASSTRRCRHIRGRLSRSLSSE